MKSGTRLRDAAPDGQLSKKRKKNSGGYFFFDPQIQDRKAAGLVLKDLRGVWQPPAVCKLL